MCFNFGTRIGSKKWGLEWERHQRPLGTQFVLGIHEETVLAQFGDKFQLYSRFIDSILGIWLVDPDPDEDQRQWTAFVALMKDYYRLKWIFEEHSKKVNYMDMTIAIREDQIITSIYEKAMNLYLYTPPPIPPTHREC